MKLKTRSGITMIELIFVIVILGIVGMIAMNLLVTFYTGTFYQEKYVERSTDLERTLNLIEKRLKYALRDSIVLLDGSDGIPCQVIGAQNGDYVLGFIGVDNDSRQGLWDGTNSYRPGWTGEADYVDAGGGLVTLTDAAANFNNADTVIRQLSAAGIGRQLDGQSAIFRYGGLSSDICNAFGWTATAIVPPVMAIVAAHSVGGTSVTIPGIVGSNANNKPYALAWSGFAFRLNGGTLTMYSNFQPWAGENYLNGVASIVAQNVSHFSIRGDSGVAHAMAGNAAFNGSFYRIDVCMREVNDNDTAANTVEKQICKEKVVYVGQ